MSEERTMSLGKIGAGAIAFVLWLATAVLALVEIRVVREMVLRVYARFIGGGNPFGANYWGGLLVGNGLTVMLALVWIALVIGGGEYHARHIGELRSWRLFARTVGVELAILVLALFI